MVNGGSVTATGHNAASYPLLLDVKGIGVNLSSTLCKTQKQAPKLISFNYHRTENRPGHLRLTHRGKEREERRAQARSMLEQ